MDWNLEGDLYFADWNGIRASADRKCLAQGLKIQFGQAEIVQAFVVPEQELSEDTESSYCRDNDLFTSLYGRDRVVDCYWRLSQIKSESISLEAIVSYRSTELTTQPIQFKMNVVPLVQDFAPQADRQESFFSPLTNTSISLLVHPLDKREVTIERHQGSFRIQVKSPQMERGVIRRARVLLDVSKGDVGSERLQEIATGFSSSDIPLTT